MGLGRVCAPFHRSRGKKSRILPFQLQGGLPFLSSGVAFGRGREKEGEASSVPAAAPSAFGSLQDRARAIIDRRHHHQASMGMYAIARLPPSLPLLVSLRLSGRPLPVPCGGGSFPSIAAAAARLLLLFPLFAPFWFCFASGKEMVPASVFPSWPLWFDELKDSTGFSRPPVSSCSWKTPTSSSFCLPFLFFSFLF